MSWVELRRYKWGFRQNWGAGKNDEHENSWTRNCRTKSYILTAITLQCSASLNKKALQLTKGNARLQCMYEGPLRTNVKSVKTFYFSAQGHSRSLLLEFWCQSKPVYDFLLVIHCNLGPISYRFRDMTSYWFKIAKFSYPPLI